MKSHYKKEFLEEIVPKYNSLSQILKFIGLSTNGGSRKTLINYINKYNINTSHFETVDEKNKRNVERLALFNRTPLDKLLVSGLTFNSSHLKNRLYCANIKQRICEKCGQNEIWHGDKMSLILDHINGCNIDNRLINLRILCPNCNATLLTTSRKKSSIAKIIKNLNA